MINSKQQAHNSAAAIASFSSSWTRPGFISFPFSRRPTLARAQQNAMNPVLTAKAVADILVGDYFSFFAKISHPV